MFSFLQLLSLTQEKILELKSNSSSSNIELLVWNSSLRDFEARLGDCDDEKEDDTESEEFPFDLLEGPLISTSLELSKSLLEILKCNIDIVVIITE